MWQGPTRTSTVSPDLFCYESLAYFDDDDFSDKTVSQTPDKNGLNHSTNLASMCYSDKKTITSSSTATSNDVHSSCRRKIDYESFENCISILDDDDYVKLLQSDDILDKPVKSSQNSRRVKEDDFTRSLLNEFTRSSKSAMVKRQEHSTNVDGSNKSRISSSDSIHSLPHNNWSQTPRSCGDYEQQVPEITLTMNNENFIANDKMDILIIKDDDMCDSDSGSEFDWNSLTPPVPASPSDQKVPETESDFDLFGDNDYGSHLAPSSSTESFMSTGFASVEQPIHHWYFQPQIALLNLEDISHSESDQVVPIL